MISKLIRRYKRFVHNSQYKYGWLYVNGCKRSRARFNRKTGDTEFVLWKPYEQGHSKNYWYRCGIGHNFIGD